MPPHDVTRDAFFLGVGHELRTPLSLVVAPIENLFERRSQLAPELARQVSLARTNASRLGRLIDAMLDLSRMGSGRLVPDLQSCDVAEQLRTLAISFAPALERAGLEFTVDLPELNRYALADSVFLERIVLNLLSNAVKFTSSGSVELRLRDRGETYVIEVTDTGPGIPEDDQERIFALFERLDPPVGTRSVVGSGIGLAMVHQLTELLGGTVSLRSELGSGSTFTVSLPYLPEVATQGGAPSVTRRGVESFLSELEPTAAPQANPLPDARPRLLIVEDDVQLAGFLADSLMDEYRVDIAPDGGSALDLMRGSCPDIVLSDVAMPGVDGIALLTAIRSDVVLRDVPVLLLSARAGQDASALGLQSGADDYITKPFAIADVRSRLAANLARVRELRADAAWRRAVLTAIQDGVVVFDQDGLVLEINQAFTDLLGYRLEDGPFTPPYPWWPTAEEDATALAAAEQSLEQFRNGREVSGEFRFYRRDRRPVWVWSAGGRMDRREAGLTAAVQTLRGIDREKAAQERRLAAAQVSADFISADDLDTVLAVAEHGFGLLFDGGTTVQLSIDGRQSFIAAGALVMPDDLPEAVRRGLAGEPSADATSRRPGILLVPPSTTADCRAWIQFSEPRRIGPDEMIVADLLAHSFALAVDGVLTAERAADRETNLEHAVESHRLIGQAVGILIERHRVLPNAAFQMLKVSSHNRNLKLREVARRVIESGLEPDEA